MRPRFKPLAEKLIPGMKESIYKTRKNVERKSGEVYTMCFGKIYWCSLDEAKMHPNLNWNFA